MFHTYVWASCNLGIPTLCRPFSCRFPEAQDIYMYMYDIVYMYVYLCTHPCRMMQLLKPGNRVYVDLTVSFDVGQGDDVPGPPIRYFFQ